MATLSLILADYPNKNGWRIENTDLFRNGALVERLAASDVVLCNPPFEIFTPEERVKYPEAAARSGSKVVAVLSAALEVRPKALGFVLPRAFLLDRVYRDHRREIERLYREVELVSLPDGVFTVSQIESALLIARDLAEPGDSQKVLASEVDDSDRRKFAFTGLPSRTREEIRPFPSSREEHLWIPPLRPLWRRLRSAPKLGDSLTGHWGLRWVERGQSKAVVDGPGANRARGVMRSRGCRQFALGDVEWIDVNPDRLYAGGSLSWGEPKILCNAGRRSRGNWRLTAAVDRNGLVASQQFVGLWEREGRDEVDLDALTAVLNGPLANAYMAEHSTEKRLRIATLLSIPMPEMLPKNVGELARQYAQAIASAPDGILEDHRLAALLNEMDCTILDAYDLPPRMVRGLLASFEGSVRLIAHEWHPWCVSINDPALTLSELRSGMLDHARGDWIRRKLKPVPGDEAAKAAPYLP